MPTSVWELDLEELEHAAGLDAARYCPYATTATESSLTAYRTTTRPSTRHKHAVAHCRAMTEWHFSHDRIAAAIDWAISSAHIAIDKNELNDAIDLLFSVLTGQEGAQFTSWADYLSRTGATKQHRRLCAIAILRLLASKQPNVPCDSENSLIDWVVAYAVDIANALEPKAARPSPIGIRTLPHFLDHRLSSITRALENDDLPALLALRANIQKAFNESTVSAITSPFLPHGFAKNSLTQIFTMANDLMSASPGSFVANYQSLFDVVEKSLDELNRQHTYFSRTLAIPLLSTIKRLAASYFAKSDAVKPAEIEVSAVDKKYPFAGSGQTILLRFVVRNKGLGPARDIAMTFLFEGPFDVHEHARAINELNRGAASVDITVQVTDPTAVVDWCVELSWQNSDDSVEDRHYSGSLAAQRSDIDWESLGKRDLYSLEPATDSGTFAGREIQISSLLKASVASSMGSSYVYGQKRVGKTSLVKILAQRVKVHVADMVVAYLEAGDYVEPSANGTICRLGRGIYRKIREQVPDYHRVAEPIFHDSLAPIVEFVEDLTHVCPRFRLLVILDEFDELPFELFKRGGIGDAFFLTLRSLAGHANVGIILVGGERVSEIIHAQGDKLNKWAPVEVDYFSREGDWLDFCDLVQRPSADALEFSPDAFERIFSWSSGNPFFCNIVCRKLLEQCVTRRDAYITSEEVELAAIATLDAIGSNTFQHFWEDGIVEARSKAEGISVRRRRILLAMANCLRSGTVPSTQVLLKDSVMAPISPPIAESEIQQFVDRGVLDRVGESLDVRVRLFRDWLRESGPKQISVRYTDEDEQAVRVKAEQDSYVTSSEILAVVKDWHIYRGSSIGPEKVRAWLEQFESNEDQRLMFQLLREIRFYSQDRSRAKHGEAMEFIKRRTIERKVVGERYRRDFVVTGFGSIGKSGTYHARLFCQENRIIGGQVCDIHGLVSLLERSVGSQGVIVVDDFIGTGRTAIEGMEALRETAGVIIAKLGIPIFLVVVCGFQSGKDAVEAAAQSLGLNVSVIVSDLLADDDKAFSIGSRAFLSDAQRVRAKMIAEEKGIRLEPHNPAGSRRLSGAHCFRRYVSQ